MEPRISLVTLGVSDLRRARSFYEATGFEPEQELQVLGQPMTYLTKRVPL